MRRSGPTRPPACQLRRAAQAPLVLVSFSTTPQGQRGAVARCIRALRHMPVRAIVTLGPAVRRQGLPKAANVRVVDSASHDALMPLCAAMICHAGHGTLIRPILHGVPVVCLPMGRDQADNSARIVQHGAGLRLPPTASARRIRTALTTLLMTPSFNENARKLGAAIRLEMDDGESAAHLLVTCSKGSPALPEYADAPLPFNRAREKRPEPSTAPAQALG